VLIRLGPRFDVTKTVTLGDRSRPFPPVRIRRRWPVPPRVWLRTGPTASTYRRAAL